MTQKFQTAYGKHKRVPFETTGPSRTHQANAAECDINYIMQKYQKTGVLEHQNKYQGNYGDYTNVPQDYHESMNAVLAANDMFMSLPSKIRRRFSNDAGQFLEFVSDQNNQSEMIEMGLASAPKTEAPADDNAPEEAPITEEE